MRKETKTLVKEEKKRRKIPGELIYERVKGSPVYYRDYMRILSGEKSLEEVMEAEKGKRWFITDWDDEVDYIEDIKFSINQLIKPGAAR